MTYGSVTVVEEEQKQLQTFKKTVVATFVAVAFVLAVVGVSAVSANSTSAAVNTNRHKGTLAAVPHVADKTEEVLNMTGTGLRYAIFEFLPCCAMECSECVMVPAKQGKASDDWAADWESFLNALPEKNDESVGIAAAVYNFEYFTAETSTNNSPLLLTWAPSDAHPKDIARAGYYLGSVILATEGVTEHYPLTSKDISYYDFCTTTMNVDADMCQLESTFHNCPFDNGGDLTDTPCTATACDGASFSSTASADDDAGAIPEDCCANINDFCADGSNAANPGCHPVTFTAITKLCAESDTDETPEIILPDNQVSQCTDDCRQPCAFFQCASPPCDSTWEQCSGCYTDGKSHTYDDATFKAQCYPGQVMFKEMQCCGLQPECSAADSNTKVACDTLGEFGCEYKQHFQCIGLVAQQQQKQEEYEYAETQRAAQAAAAEAAAAAAAGTTSAP
jgi:hypothetical protein